MSVKGFKLDDGSIAKYDYNSLENITTDTTLSSSGVAADARTTGDALDGISDIIGDISDTIGDVTNLETTTQSSIVDAINEIKESIDGIGRVYTANWIATSSSSNNTSLTDYLTLPAGTYIIIAISPVASADFSVGLASKFKRMNGYGDAFAIIHTFSSESSLRLIAAQSAAVTFTYTERGSLIALRIKGTESDDDSSSTVIESAISELQSDVSALQSTVNNLVTTESENGWTYRKYSDGTFDMWKKYYGAPATGTHYSTSNGFYGYYIQTGNFPSGCKPIDTNYCVQSTWGIGNGFSIQAGHLSASTTTPGNLYALGTQASVSTVTVEMRICGRWR